MNPAGRQSQSPSRPGGHAARTGTRPHPGKTPSQFRYLKVRSRAIRYRVRQVSQTFSRGAFPCRMRRVVPVAIDHSFPKGAAPPNDGWQLPSRSTRRVIGFSRAAEYAKIPGRWQVPIAPTEVLECDVNPGIFYLRGSRNSISTVRRQVHGRWLQPIHCLLYPRPSPRARDGPPRLPDICLV
jgi:hypothetical protein